MNRGRAMEQVHPLHLERTVPCMTVNGVTGRVVVDSCKQNVVTCARVCGERRLKCRWWTRL